MAYGCVDPAGRAAGSVDVAALLDWHRAATRGAVFVCRKPTVPPGGASFIWTFHLDDTQWRRAGGVGYVGRRKNPQPIR
jgi:hypothetical protein